MSTTTPRISTNFPFFFVQKLQAEPNSLLLPHRDLRDAGKPHLSILTAAAINSYAPAEEIPTFFARHA